MPVIEILCYTPKNMDEFIPYCIHGKRDKKGDYETDDQGRKITGVIRWLLGRGVPKAEFFNSRPKDNPPVNLFASTVQRRESFDVPWMKNIPGFEDMVTTEGLIGKIEKFAALSDLLASVESNPELNEKFIQGREDLDRILKAIEENRELMPSVGTETLLAALRGEKESNPAAVFEQVKKNFEFRLND